MRILGNAYYDSDLRIMKTKKKRSNMAVVSPFQRDPELTTWTWRGEISSIFSEFIFIYFF